MHQPQASSIVHWTWTGDSFHTWYYTCFNAILLNHPTLWQNQYNIVKLKNKIKKNKVEKLKKKQNVLQNIEDSILT